MVKEEMIVYAVAEKEDISVSDDEYDKFIEDQLSQYGYTEEQYEEQTGKSYEEANGKENIKTQVCKDKVQDFMLKHAKVKKSKNWFHLTDNDNQLKRDPLMWGLFFCGFSDR